MKNKLFFSALLLGMLASVSACGGTTNENGDNNDTDDNEPPITDKILVDKITLDKGSAELGVGGTYQLSWTVAPENADNKDVTFTSSNTSVASVSDEGLVTALAIGSSTITVSSADDGDASATFTVNVSEASYVERINIEGAEYDYDANGNFVGYIITIPEKTDTVTISYTIAEPENCNVPELYVSTATEFANFKDNYIVSENNTLTIPYKTDTRVYNKRDWDAVNIDDPWSALDYTFNIHIFLESANPNN